MDKDEVEDVGISVEGLADSNIIDIAEKRLEEAGNMVGSFLQLDKTSMLMSFSQIMELRWILSGQQLPLS